MRDVFNVLASIVAIGIVSLFATFFSVLGLHKREVWNVIFNLILFEGREKNEGNNKINDL